MSLALNPLPFSQACENNKAPIAKVLKEVFEDRHRVLEIGSGTGQHAVYLCEKIPHLHWQCSDQSLENRGLKERLTAANSPHLPLPRILNVLETPYWGDHYDAVFSANTMHIMHWEGVKKFWEGASSLAVGAKVAIYGPFNYGGYFTSESNYQFDASLKSQDPGMGIREFHEVDALALERDFLLFADVCMPANNRLIIWQHKG